MGNLYKYMMEKGAKLGNTGRIFLKNFKDMEDANTYYADKYFHALANCQAAQNASTTGAKAISAGRELADMLIKNPLKGISVKDNVEDSLDDWNVDVYGLNQGLLYPNADCRGLVNKYRPRGLNPRY